MQKSSKVDITKKEDFSKSVIKKLYESKFLVRGYIFKLVYHCEVSRWSEICFARDIAKNFFNRLLLLLILKSWYPRCSVEKGVLKNFTNFTGKHLSWSPFLIKLQGWGPSASLKRNSNAVFQWYLQNFLEHLLLRASVKDCCCISI